MGGGEAQNAAGSGTERGAPHWQRHRAEPPRTATRDRGLGEGRLVAEGAAVKEKASCAAAPPASSASSSSAMTLLLETCRQAPQHTRSQRRGNRAAPLAPRRDRLSARRAVQQLCCRSPPSAAPACAIFEPIECCLRRGLRRSPASLARLAQRVSPTRVELRDSSCPHSGVAAKRAVGSDCFNRRFAVTHPFSDPGPTC